MTLSIIPPEVTRLKIIFSKAADAPVSLKQTHIVMTDTKKD